MLAFIIVLFIIFNLKIKTRKLIWKIVKLPFILLFFPIKYWNKQQQLIKKQQLIENKKAEKERLKKEKLENKIKSIQDKINS